MKRAGSRKMTVTELADRWRREAKRHEDVALEFTADDDEWWLHLEVARVLRVCSREVAECER